MPQASPVAWSRVAVHTVVALCILALLATVVADETAPVSANALSNEISANRAGQLYAERAMLAQDQALAAVKRDQKAVKRDLKRAKRDLKRGRSALATAKSVLRERRARYARVEALFEDPSLAPSPEAYAQRLKRLRRDIRVAERRKVTIGTRVRVMTRGVRARQARVHSLKRARSATLARRAAAESVLAGRIVHMTQLAAERVANQAATGLSASESFSWPATGRISQPYGCTGFRLNPRRGSCRHFHDGIDIVDRSGTAVRAVGVGVVAYAGWNPWDHRSRAWIVVVSHLDGFVSRYGHLTPTDRVRAGELVHTGQIIGKMGNTGYSTGTHLHFELLHRGRDVNPTSYLPAGVIKVDKASTKRGKRALEAKQKARQKARQKAKQKAREQARKEAARSALEQALVPPAAGIEALTVTADDPCAPVPPDASGSLLLPLATSAAEASPPECEPPTSDDGPDGPSLVSPDRAGPGLSSRPTSQAPPGVPRPRLGTSPVPA